VNKDRFHEFFHDTSYRELKMRARRTYDLLSTVSEKRKLYTELEKDYARKLEEMAKSIEEKEAELAFTPSEAEEVAEELKLALKDAGEKIKGQRREVRLNKLRFVSGEYGLDVFESKKVELRNILEKEIADAAWLKESIAFLRRQKSKTDGGPKDITSIMPAPADIAPVTDRPAVRTQKVVIGQALEDGFAKDEIEYGKNMEGAVKNVNPPSEKKEEPKPAQPAEESPKPKSQTAVNMDQTMAISEAMIGSAPQRLLEPALMIQKKDGLERFPLGRKDVNIGNIRNPENEVSLYDTQASRKHGKIVYDNLTESWFYVDLGSTNGSSHNGRALAPNDPIILKNGDKLMVGDTEIMIYIP